TCQRFPFFTGFAAFVAFVAFAAESLEEALPAALVAALAVVPVEALAGFPPVDLAAFAGFLFAIGSGARGTEPEIAPPKPLRAGDARLAAFFGAAGVAPGPRARLGLVPASARPSVPRGAASRRALS